MTSLFSSNFKSQLGEFIRQKHAVGFPYESSELRLRAFDRFCIRHHPRETRLTKEIAMHWAEKLPREHVNTLIRRITPIRQFAKYLNSIGSEAYVIPSGIPAKGVRYVPHIYTKEELTAFFRELDHCLYNSNSPARHLVVSVIFRVLYCCGLRSSEVLGLKVEDVDLVTGKLFICQSKGHKDRTVVMSDDILKLCQIYHSRVSLIFTNRVYFFPNHRGHHYNRQFLDFTFREFWTKTGIVFTNGNPPRVHDFRHTFAVNRLNQWVKEEKDLNAYLPYLSMYLGHEHLTDTDYYLHLVPEFFPVLTSESDERFSQLIPEAKK
ncbi:tyrosine-type recombinase/integrase [Alicyclobacillus sp. SO9]|uniref:tyrosine-type recombinase/integrase n=1 Tax=Alicyclobacillus sp. SO9 TaxID=2665646 RepID=UPI0018E854CE|nr:tyrosine-type recombinase/integrase [Alicyclobacillus sp. SO9]QQE78438.1 tyrosine-type recombinase/integrase [Alicyclobacillus sp. SO9]